MIERLEGGREHTHEAMHSPVNDKCLDVRVQISVDTQNVYISTQQHIPQHCLMM